MPPELLAFDRVRGFIVAQANESGMAKVIVLGPLQKLELADQDWLQPPAIRHLCLR